VSLTKTAGLGSLQDTGGNDEQDGGTSGKDGFFSGLCFFTSN